MSQATSRWRCRADPTLTIRAWDHLVSHTPGSDVAQLSAWSAVREQAGCVPRYVLARPITIVTNSATMGSSNVKAGYLVRARIPAIP